MNFILLHLLRCFLWPRIWFILVNIPCELKKNVYSDVTGVLHICQLDQGD